MHNLSKNLQTFVNYFLLEKQIKLIIKLEPSIDYFFDDSDWSSFS